MSLGPLQWGHLVLTTMCLHCAHYTVPTGHRAHLIPTTPCSARATPCSPRSQCPVGPGRGGGGAGDAVGGGRRRRHRRPLAHRVRRRRRGALACRRRGDAAGGGRGATAGRLRGVLMAARTERRRDGRPAAARPERRPRRQHVILDDWMARHAQLLVSASTTCNF